MRPVAGYEGKYSVSSTGRVWSHPNRLHDGKWLTPSLRKGYQFVCLCNKGDVKMFSVHRLVAIAYLANKNGFNQINHKNGIKADNRVTNLEWCSGSHNIKHAWDNGMIEVTQKKRIASKNNAYTMLRKRVKGRYLGESA